MQLIDGAAEASRTQQDGVTNTFTVISSTLWKINAFGFSDEINLIKKDQNKDDQRWLKEENM